MREIIIASMLNPRPMVRSLQATEASCLTKSNIPNHFCMGTVIGHIKPWGIFKNKNYMLLEMYGATTNIIARACQVGWRQSVPRDDLWQCERKCEPFINCSLSHLESWANWSWCLNTASQQLKKHSGMSQLFHISGKPQFDFFFEFVGTIN